MTESRDDAAKKARSALADAGFSVRDLSFVPEGRAHTVFRATTSDGELYVKVSGSPRPRFVNEANALEVVSGRLEGVPELVPTGRGDILVTRSLGADLRPIRADDVEAWASFGEWLNALHRIDPAGSGVRYDTDPLPLPERMVKTVTRAAKRLDRRLHDLEDRCNELRQQDDARGLVHRDLRWDNILVDRRTGAFRGVVDFEHAAAANPAWDLVKPLLWRKPSTAAKAAFDTGYNGSMKRGDASLFAWFEAVTVLAYMSDRDDYVRWANDVLGSPGEPSR